MLAGNCRTMNGAIAAPNKADGTTNMRYPTRAIEEEPLDRRKKDGKASPQNARADICKQILQ
jgi:hypothetical protein